MFNTIMLGLAEPSERVPLVRACVSGDLAPCDWPCGQTEISAPHKLGNRFHLG